MGNSGEREFQRMVLFSVTSGIKVLLMVFKLPVFA
jgi:hypothetical protein